MTIKLLIVDDSSVVRQTLQRELEKSKDIEIVGTAPDPFVARDMIVRLKPHVLTLDIEMPRMDGITFLKKLMQYYPLPVIIVSSLAQKGSQIALDAIHAGAVDVVAKPGQAYSVGDMAVELRDKIVAAAHVDIKKFVSQAEQNRNLPKVTAALSKTTNKVIVIGASTGGTQAIEYILAQFPANAPPTAIVQHMPAGFTKSFADRLDELCQVEVREAQDDDSLTPGRVLIAPGNMHMLVRRSGARYCVNVKSGPLVNRHRPSVDVLFQSSAESLGPNAIGLMLTGMGADGAQSMLKMKVAGAVNFAQDENSCVVYGMPRAAVEVGAVHHVLPLSEIARRIISEASKY